MSVDQLADGHMMPVVLRQRPKAAPSEASRHMTTTVLPLIIYRRRLKCPVIVVFRSAKERLSRSENVAGASSRSIRRSGWKPLPRDFFTASERNQSGSRGNRGLTPNAVYLAPKVPNPRPRASRPLVFGKSVAGGTPADRPRHPSRWHWANAQRLIFSQPRSEGDYPTGRGVDGCIAEQALNGEHRLTGNPRIARDGPN